MAASSSPVRERVEIRSDKDRDVKAWTVPESINGGGLTGRKVPLEGVNDNRIFDAEDTISISARHIQTELNLRGDFEAALRGFIEDFKANQEKTVLPDAPAREYRPRESIIDYLRSPEGFGPWVEAGALTRPLLNKLQPKAYTALANWLRNNELPADLPVPKKSDVTNHRASSLLQSDPETVRAAKAIYERQRLAARAP